MKEFYSRDCARSSRWKSKYTEVVAGQNGEDTVGERKSLRSCWDNSVG